MKKIINLIIDFLKNDFNFFEYLVSILFLIFLFVFNYTDFFGESQNNLKHNQYYFYILSFIVVSIPFLIRFRFNIKVFIAIIFTFSVIAVNYYTKDFVTYFYQLFQDFNDFAFLRQNFLNLQKFLALSLPLILVYQFQKKEIPNFYGLSSKNFNFKPYLIMLLVMIPLIYFASFSDSFMRIYPRYMPASEDYGVIDYLKIGIFEFLYFLRFVGVELFFRGFMIIGLSKLLGERVILSTAVIYSAWHFGKPMGEAAGAFFGGYILGIFALRTNSIYGGIIIHYGIALLMEIFAYYQKSG